MFDRQDSAWLIRSVSTPTLFVRVLYWCSSPCLQGGTFFMNIQKNIQELLKLLCFFNSSENCLNFQGCFTVQLSRFFARTAPFVFFLPKVSLARQQVISYQNFLHLSTLFLIFFKYFSFAKN